MSSDRILTEVINRELKVRINMSHAPRRMELLTPDSSLRWGRCRFEFNPPNVGEADFSIVLWNARSIDQCSVAFENTLFIAGEPSSKKVYPKDFYSQFGRIVDTHDFSGHPRTTISALGLNWHVGLNLETGSYDYGYDYLLKLDRPQKINKVSVVCSDAAFTPGQRLRLDLLNRLKSRLGDRLVHYGRGFRPINDKMDAILPYRFHLALENSELPHYWTEKIADAYLGWAFPLYVGCPNLEKYFSSDAFLRLNPHDADDVADRILKLLDTPSEPTEEVKVSEARLRVLQFYNPFARCSYWAEKWFNESPCEIVTTRSNKAFRPFPQGFIYRLRSRSLNKKEHRY